MLIDVWLTVGGMEAVLLSWIFQGGCSNAATAAHLVSWDAVGHRGCLAAGGNGAWR